MHIDTTETIVDYLEGLIDIEGNDTETAIEYLEGMEG